MDECQNQPCQNGGTCIDLVNHFKCSCPPGTRGMKSALPVLCPGHSQSYESNFSVEGFFVCSFVFLSKHLVLNPGNSAIHSLISCLALKF